MPGRPVNASFSSSPASIPGIRGHSAACGLAPGYLAFAVPKPLRRERLCRDMLGLPEAVADPDGRLGYRMDGAMQRLIVTGGADVIQ